MATRSDTLAPTWKEGRVVSWLTTVDHKRIGVLYIVTAFGFFFAAGLMALLMRIQLAQADNDFITKDGYTQLFTMHGTAMIFLFVVPILAGFANYLIPLMIGARDVAFPRLNALTYWLFLMGGIVLLTSFLAESGAANSGWTGYVPLSSKEGSPGVGQDLWILGIHLTSIASLAGAINFIVTIHNMRAPGMTWMRIPLFAWAIEAYSVLLLLALPAISAAATLLLLDRQAGTDFFAPENGGPILWQHMFWFFGHPEVYIMVLPAMGMLSEIIPVFSRKPIFGYKAIAFSTIGIAFASMLVWAHHMFTVGMPAWLQGWFLVTSFSVAVPTSIKIFNWLATLWRGQLIFRAPLLFCLGFIGLFTLGGLTGLFLAALAVDVHVHDTYFIVAHFHYIMVGGAIMGYLGGIHYWWPKITGRLYSEPWAKLAAAIVFVGFNLTFFPQFVAGYIGMPRRYHAYPPEFQVLNVLSTAGASVLAVGYMLPLFYLAYSLVKGAKSPADPWGAKGLEWEIPSPPPTENFTISPIVTHGTHQYAPSKEVGVV